MKKLFLALIIFLISVSSSYASQRIEPLSTWLDSNGDPATSYQLFVYENGTTTKITVYNEPTLTTPHTNPVILNSSGRPAGDKPVYFSGTVTLVFALDTDSDPPASPIYTINDYRGSYVGIPTEYYLSDSDDIADAATTLNALNADLVLVIDEDSTMDENVSFDAEVIIKPINGSVITIPSGYTITIQSPEHIIAGDKQQIFNVSSSDLQPVLFNEAGRISGHWFGAAGDGSTDDRDSLQKAIHSLCYIPASPGAFSGAGGTLYLPGGEYLIDSTYEPPDDGAGSPWGASDTRGLFVYGDGSVAVWLVGDGYSNTIISSSDGSGIDDILYWVNSGVRGGIKNLSINPGDTSTKGIYLQSSCDISGIWFNGASVGLHIYRVGSVILSNLLFTSCNIGLHSNGAHDIKGTNFFFEGGSTNGIKIDGSSADFGLDHPINPGAGTEPNTGAAILLSNIRLRQLNDSGHNIYIDVDGVEIPVHLTNVTSEMNPTRYNARLVYVKTSWSVHLNNCDLSHGEYYGIEAIQSTKGIFVNGGGIRRSGYWNQTTETVSAGIIASSGVSTLSVNGTLFSDNAGYAIYTQATNNIISSCTFDNNINGGYNNADGDAGAHATTGDDVIFLDPQATTFHAKIFNNHFLGGTAAQGGQSKNAIYINDTAIPATGNIKIIGNNKAIGEYDTDLTGDTDITDIVLNTYEIIMNNGFIDDYGYIGASIGGTGADTSSYTGLLGFTAGVAYEVNTLAELESAVNAGAYFSDLAAATSKANAATLTGVGTGDSPQFTGIEVGHADDTTITRGEAGVIEIQGDPVVMASAIGSTVQAIVTTGSLPNNSVVKDDLATALQETTQDVTIDSDPKTVTYTKGYKVVKIHCTSVSADLYEIRLDETDAVEGDVIWVINDVANRVYFQTYPVGTGTTQYCPESPLYLAQYETAKFEYQSDRWICIGHETSTLALSDINLGNGILEIPNSDDPDLTATGQISFDTDGWVRGTDDDGTTQFSIGRKLDTYQITVPTPNDLADATRDACMFFENHSGMSFIITHWYGVSDTDDTTLNLEETDADGQNNTTIDAVEIATDGTGVYTADDGTITAATIEDGHRVLIDFDDTDDPGQVHITIVGYYDANVD